MITLKDRLSRLTYREACRLLGDDGEHLIGRGGRYDIDIEHQVTWQDDLLKIRVDEATVAVSQSAERPKFLRFTCSQCTRACEHLGAALSLILEEKLSLGLSAPPPEKVPVESLPDEALVGLAIEERAERAKTEKMVLKAIGGNGVWADYTITNRSSGKSYRVALRGWERGESYCSCPDFKKNTLGTCKHVIYALSEIKKRFPKSALQKPFRVTDIAVHLRYGEQTELRILVPERVDKEAMALLHPVVKSSGQGCQGSDRPK